MTTYPLTDDHYRHLSAHVLQLRRAILGYLAAGLGLGAALTLIVVLQFGGAGCLVPPLFGAIIVLGIAFIGRDIRLCQRDLREGQYRLYSGPVRLEPRYSRGDTLVYYVLVMGEERLRLPLYQGRHIDDQRPQEVAYAPHSRLLLDIKAISY